MLENAESTIITLYLLSKIGRVFFALSFIFGLALFAGIIMYWEGCESDANNGAKFGRRLLLTAVIGMPICVTACNLAPNPQEVMLAAKYLVVKGGVQDFQQTDLGKLVVDRVKRELQEDLK